MGRIGSPAPPPRASTSSFLRERWRARSPGASGPRTIALSKSKGAGRQGPAHNVFRMPVAWRAARFLCGLFATPPSGPTPLVGRSVLERPMQPHCARLVVAGRRRDRDGPRTKAARTVKRRSGRPSHGPPSPRRGPPPLRRRIRCTRRLPRWRFSNMSETGMDRGGQAFISR